MTYLLTINGTEITAEDAGVSFGGLDLANMRDDSASFQWSRRAPDQACPFAHDDVVEIFADGRRLFVGRARIGAIGATGAPVKIIGPWSHLEEQQYHVSLASGHIGEPDGLILGDTYAVTYPAGSSLWNGTGYTTIGADHTITFTMSGRSRYTGYPATTAESDINMAWSARCWLFRPSGTPGQVYTTVQDELDRLMTFMAHTNAPDLFTLGTVELGDELAPRVRTVSDALVADCIRQVLGTKPDASVFMDYSGTGLAVVKVRVAALETPLVLTIGDSAGQVQSDYKIRKANELMPTGVVIRWENNENDAVGIGSPVLADVYPGQEVARGVATVTHGSTAVSILGGTDHLEIGMKVVGSWVGQGAVITAKTGEGFTMSQPGYGGVGVDPGDTIAVSRMIFRKSDAVASYHPGVLLHTVTDDITPAPGIAKEIYTSLAVLRGVGSLTVIDPDFSLGLRPGMVIHLAGDVELEGVQLWVQSVSWDAGTGLAQLTVGYPAHLQLRERVDLKGWLRVSFNGPFFSFSWIVPPP